MIIWSKRLLFRKRTLCAALGGYEPAGEPVAYLYNGVRLPKLPEWDKEAYPYVTLYYLIAKDQYKFYATSVPGVYQTPIDSIITGYQNVVQFGNTASEPKLSATLTEGAWEIKDGSGLYIAIDKKDGTALAEIVWSNYDILDKEGMTYFGGNIPLPVALFESGTWNFNGVQLPYLPTWDMSAYPYAVIYHQIVGKKYLFVSETPWLGTGENHADIYDGGAGEATENTSAGVLFFYKDNNWVQQSMSNPPKLGQLQDTDGDGVGDSGAFCAFWANHDIIGKDGSALIAASDPVPVYE